MMYQCLPQMPLKALGTGPLCSVGLLQELESTTDAARRCKSQPALEDPPQRLAIFQVKFLLCGQLTLMISYIVGDPIARGAP